MALLDFDGLGAPVGGRLPFPTLDLLDAALGIFIERNAELLDQIGPAVLDEIGRVFGEIAPSFR